MTPDSAALQAKLDLSTRIFKALSHPSRLMICCQLRDGEMSVGAIEDTLGIRQPVLSRELGKLRDAELVETRRESKVIFYRLADETVHRIIDAMCGVLLGEPVIARAHASAGPKPLAQSGGYGVFARVQPEPNGGIHDPS